MLLLDDGTHFTLKTTAATKSIKASRLVWLDLLHHLHLQVQLPTQVFLDFVVQQVMVRPFVRQQVRQQKPVQQGKPVQQTVRWQRLLDAISSQLSALPPPAACWIISPPVI